MALAVVLSTKRLIAVTVVVIVCAGCGGTTSTDRVAAILPTLDKAVYADCGQQRDQAARYLVTGQPQSLDPHYLDERAAVLKQPQAVQDAYIRQYVNQVVADCDGAELARIQLAAFTASCTSKGGSIAPRDGSTPGWTYPGAYRAGQCIVYVQFSGGHEGIYVVPLSADGTWDTSQYDRNLAACTNAGHPTSFNSSTGICEMLTRT
jgi:hypothetical protein